LSKYDWLLQFSANSPMVIFNSVGSRWLFAFVAKVWYISATAHSWFISLWGSLIMINLLLLVIRPELCCIVSQNYNLTLRLNSYCTSTNICRQGDSPEMTASCHCEAFLVKAEAISSCSKIRRGGEIASLRSQRHRKSVESLKAFLFLLKIPLNSPNNGCRIGPAKPR